MWLLEIYYNVVSRDVIKSIEKAVPEERKVLEEEAKKIFEKCRSLKYIGSRFHSNQCGVIVHPIRHGERR